MIAVIAGFGRGGAESYVYNKWSINVKVIKCVYFIIFNDKTVLYNFEYKEQLEHKIIFILLVYVYVNIYFLQDVSGMYMLLNIIMILYKKENNYILSVSILTHA